MKVLHLTNKDYATGTWSGGTTTELFIWPRGASYARREFGFRISSAAVELGESDFTPLAGVQRYITPLTGGFTLTHPGSEPVVLEPMAEPYGFSGEVATHCVGKATDLNFMLKGVEGAMTLEQGEFTLGRGFYGFYAHEPGVFTLAAETYAMEAGDLLAVFSRGPAKILLGPVPVLTCRADI